MTETCDRCGQYVRAEFRVIGPKHGQQLTLCSHHARRYEPHLAEWVYLPVGSEWERQALQAGSKALASL